MNDSYVRLQRTLRAIECGERLDSLDDLLVREVLHQSPPPLRPTLTPTPASTSTIPDDAVRGSDAYRVLVQLRRQRQKAKDEVPKQKAAEEAKQRPSPEKKQKGIKTVANDSRTKRGYPPDKQDVDLQQQHRHQKETMAREAKAVAASRHEMAASLAETQRRLHASQLDVEHVTHEMDALLAASQSILSSTFLFERNLTEFCHERSLEVIQRVLQRFQHRYYALYYQKWVEHTQQLRRDHQRRAVATIVRVVRGHNARTLRRILQKEAATLATQARQVVELRVSYRSHQALKLQRVWHRFQWTYREKARQRRTQATVYLQQQWRNRRLRQNDLITALLNVKAIRAAIRIQACVRGHLSRRELTRQRRETQRQAIAMQVLTRNTSRAAMLQWLLERHGAAFVITKAMYPMLIRQRFRQLTKQLKRQHAGRVIAVNVGLWYRTSSRYKQRQHASVAERLRSLLHQEQRRLEQASVLIQKIIRRWWYQQLYETQQRRRNKLARLERLHEKQARLAVHKAEGGGGRAAVTLAKVSAGLVDTMKQVQKKTSAQAIDIPSNAASKIQRAYLRHHHYKHFQFTLWRRRACAVEARVRQRRKAAIQIQKHTRGLLARRIVRGQRAKRLLQRQIVRWKWRRATRRSRAAKQILHWLRRKEMQRRARLWKHETTRRSAMATTLQRWLRRGFFYRRRTAKVLAIHRKRMEAQLFATQSLVVSVQHVSDQLILQSVQSKAFGESLKLYINDRGAIILQKPPAHARFPFLPLLFLVISGFKDLALYPTLDLQKDLLVAKVERSKMVALFKAANKHSHTLPRRQHKAAEAFALNDVDVAMAKAAGASKTALGFVEFINTLQRLADMKLQSITLWWNKYGGGEARLLALLWQFIFPIAELTPLVQELSLYTDRVINAHARVAQRLFVRRRDIAHGHLIKLQKMQQREMEMKRRAIIKVQANVRRLLARTIHRTRIQAQYDKYIDPEWNLPYWMNPKTGFSTWQKPWVLGDFDVHREVVPFPPPDKILVVACQGVSDCATCSDWYCFACDAFFCRDCEPTFHRKNDSDHEMEKLRKCGLCKFQIASRHCDGCADAVKKCKRIRPIQHSEDPENPKNLENPEEDDSASYCDVCFAFAHRRGALQVHLSTPLVELCRDCQDDDAELAAPSAPLVVRPYPRAVQWMCATDAARVCSYCAWSRHPIEACGDLTRLPLSTTRMRDHAERLAREQDERERRDSELNRSRELQIKQTRAVKKIQRFWRNSAPLIRARHIVRTLRTERDTQWHQFQHDAAVQRTVQYQIQHALGRAPPLPSDSLAQRKLREMNAIQRRHVSIRARAFGLLLPEYMELGVPLPGVARVVGGAKYIECSEDLRGWIINRQTLRLKKLPPKAQRDRMRRLRFRHLEPPLEDKVWLHDLEKWRRDPTDTVLVDVDAKQRITEHNIPLAAAFVQSTSGEGGEEYALFLVEFSMDPTRIVWVSHSLVERFAVWRKQKLSEHREKHRLQVDAPHPIQSAGLVLPVSAAVDHMREGDETLQPVAFTEGQANALPAADAAPWGDYANYGYNNYNYYGQNAWPATSENWSNTSYDAVAPPVESASYYDYSTSVPTAGATAYDALYPTGVNYEPAPIDTLLVDSTDYFHSDDGNAAAWQAYYAAHPEMVTGDYGYTTQPQTQQSDPYAYEGYDASLVAQDAWGCGSDASGYAAPDPNAAYADPAYYAPQDPSASTLTTWEEVFDPASQQTYYYNRETQQTSWEYPSTTEK